MLKEERQNFILEQIRTYNKVKSNVLSEKLNVSEDTIRRDLKELAEKGHIKKVHGGAMASSYLPLKLKNDQELQDDEEVLKIVNKATQLLENHQVIIMDGGNINLKLVDNLSLNLHATIFTNSLLIALKLCDFMHIEVVFLGGAILKKEQSSTGMDVINFLSDIHADICFLNTHSIHPEIGLTDTNREEAVTKKAIIKSSNKVVSLAKSDKIGTIQPFKIEKITQVHTLISELDANDKLLIPFQNKGLQIL